MATVEFKFDVGDKVYLTDELRPDVAFMAKCYTVETMLHGESGNKYSMRSGNREWHTEEDRIVHASEAKNFAISNCTKLMQQIAGLKFEA